MPSQAVERCLQELQTSHDALRERLTALQLYGQQGVVDDTRTWLQEQIGAHRTRLALLEGVMGGLQTVAGTDYPDLALAPMSAEVQENLAAIHAQWTKTNETMAATMNVLKPSAPPPMAEVMPTAESETREAREGRRSRRDTENA